MHYRSVGSATGNVLIVGLLLDTGRGDGSHAAGAHVYILVVRLHQRWHLGPALPEEEVLVGYVLFGGGCEKAAAVSPSGTPDMVPPQALGQRALTANAAPA